MLKFQFFPYELLFKRNQGKRPGFEQSRRGALLRFEFSGSRVGYADCHPWPELGDEALDAQLARLAQSRLTGLTRQSLFFAKLDAQARFEKKSLWQALKDPLPESHFLISSLEDFNQKFLLSLIERGFRVFKLKLGSQLKEELSRLEELRDFLLTFHKSHALSLRLDFNCLCSMSEVSHFLDKIGPLRGVVELIEDPCSYDACAWSSLQRRWGIPLALDRAAFEWSFIQCEQHPRPESLGFSIIVLKPAIQDPKPLLVWAQKNDFRVLVTSYLDHPLGQAWALFTASALKLDCFGKCLLDVGGFFSHAVYKTHALSHFFQTDGPRFQKPNGADRDFGIGWDKDLRQLGWQRYISS